MSFLGDLGLQVAGGLVNSFLGKSSADQAFERQKELMDYQMKLQESQFEKYTSPQAQVRNLAAAGINPAVAMGNQSPVFSSVPNAPTPGSVQPAQFGIGTTSLTDLANYMLAKANAQKAGVETEGTVLDNEVKRRTLEDRVKQIGLDNHWTAEQTAKVTQEIGLLSGQFNEIQQRIENMRSEKQLTDKQVSWYDRNISAEIADLQASAEYKKAVAGLTDSQKQLLDDTMEDLKTITNLNAQQMEKIVSLLDKYGDAQAIVGMLSQVVGSASDLIGSIASFKNIGKTVETITGTTTQKSDGSWSTTNTRTTRK